jgi:dihydroorotate dehydrogenase
MGIYRRIVRPILFRCDPEWVHERTIRLGRLVGDLRPLRSALAALHGVRDPRLRTEVCGLAFSNPIGLAAGYDKNGRAIPVMEALGFGHVEIGSVSADPSPGNPSPRLWRLPEDRGLCVYYGLPNEGAEAVAARLGRIERSVPLGVNIVATNRGIDARPVSEDVIVADYARSVRALHDHADYLCLNLSCPNTGTGRDHFCEPVRVRRLLDALAGLTIRRPVFLKVSPLGGVAAIEGLLDAVEGLDFVSGFSFNLPPGLPAGLRTLGASPASMRGAVAGKPVEGLINACIGELYHRMDRRRYRIIGVGGVFSAEDAYEKIRLGASLVQLMTGLIYEGPGLVRRINEGLCRLLQRDGLSHVAEAVGSAHSEGSRRARYPSLDPA